MEGNFNYQHMLQEGDGITFIPLRVFFLSVIANGAGDQILRSQYLFVTTNKMLVLTRSGLNYSKRVLVPP